MPSKANLAMIHIAKKELALTDEHYRIILDAVTGKESAASITDLQATAVLERFKELGWKAKQARKKGKRPRNMEDFGSKAEQLKKIEALLTVGGKSWAYADGIAKRICKVDKVEWVTDGNLYKVITALRMQAKREGWDLSGERK
jgi:phage gp16-like protein